MATTESSSRHPELAGLASQAVLATTIATPDLLPRLVESLRLEDFQDPRDREVFAIVARRHRAGEAIDLTLVASELEGKGFGAFASLGSFLEHLEFAQCSPTNLDYHIDNIIRCSSLRDLRQLEAGSTRELREKLQEQLDRLEPIEDSSPDPIVTEMVAAAQEVDITTAESVEPALLYPFWAVGDQLMLVGKRSSGKSTIAAELILAAIIPCRRGRALGGVFEFNLDLLGRGLIAFIDGENTLGRCGSLLRRLVEHTGIDVEEAARLIRERVLYFSAKDLGIRNEATWSERSEALAEALARHNVRFYVLDSAGRFWGAKNLSEMGWVQQGMAVLAEACKAQDPPITGLILGHVRRKGEDGGEPADPLGSSTQENYTDGYIAIDCKGGKQRLTLMKSRRATWIREGAAVTVGWPDKGYGYEPEGNWMSTWPHEPPAVDDEAVDDVNANSSQAKALNFVQTKPGLSVDEIARGVGVSDRQARRLLNKLKEIQKVESKDHGWWPSDSSSSGGVQTPPIP